MTEQKIIEWFANDCKNYPFYEYERYCAERDIPQKIEDAVAKEDLDLEECILKGWDLAHHEELVKVLTYVIKECEQAYENKEGYAVEVGKNTGVYIENIYSITDNPKAYLEEIEDKYVDPENGERIHLEDFEKEYGEAETLVNCSACATIEGVEEGPSCFSLVDGNDFIIEICKTEEDIIPFYSDFRYVGEIRKVDVEAILKGEI